MVYETLTKQRRIGERRSPRASAAKRHEIFISPGLGDALEALGTLVHELVHAAVGTGTGHRGRFGTIARKLGLLPPMTCTTPGLELVARLNALLAEIGPYPHARPRCRRQRAGSNRRGCLKLCARVVEQPTGRPQPGSDADCRGAMRPDPADTSQLPSGAALTRMIVQPEEIATDPLTGREYRWPKQLETLGYCRFKRTKEDNTDSSACVHCQACVLPPDQSNRVPTSST